MARAAVIMLRGCSAAARLQVRWVSSKQDDRAAAFAAVREAHQQNQILGAAQVKAVADHAAALMPREMIVVFEAASKSVNAGPEAVAARRELVAAAEPSVAASLSQYTDTQMISLAAAVAHTAPDGSRPMAPLFRELGRQAAQWRRWPAGNVLTAVGAFARAAHSSAELHDAAVQALQGRVSKAFAAEGKRYRSYSILPTAFARARFAPAAFLDEFAALCTERAGVIRPDDIVEVVHAYAQLTHAAPALCKAVAGRFADPKSIKRINPPELARLYWSFSTLSVHDREFTNVMTQALNNVKRTELPVDAVMKAFRGMIISQADELSVNSLAHHIAMTAVPSLGPADLRCLAAFYAERPLAAPRALCTSVTQRLLDSVPAIDAMPHDESVLPALLWDLCRLQRGVASEAPPAAVFEAVLPVVTRHARQHYTAPELATLAAAYAAAKVPAPGLFAVVADAFLKRADQADAGTFRLALATFDEIGYDTPAFFDGVAAALRRRVREAERRC